MELMGVDVRGIFHAAGLTKINLAVQAKRWKSNVGAPKVKELRGSLGVHEHGVIVTTKGFSKKAREEAVDPTKTQIGLVDVDTLVELLIEHRIGIEEKTLQVLSLDKEYWGFVADETTALVKPQAIVSPSTTIPAVVDTSTTPVDPVCHNG